MDFVNVIRLNANNIYNNSYLNRIWANLLKYFLTSSLVLFSDFCHNR